MTLAIKSLSLFKLICDYPYLLLCLIKLFQKILPFGIKKSPNFLLDIYLNNIGFFKQLIKYIIAFCALC